MAKKAIVIGATGVVGSALVKLLAEHPSFYQIVTLTRREAPFPHAKVRNQVIDFDDLSNHAHLIQGDCVFSCLGTTKKQVGSIAAQRVVDFDYQYLVARIAALNGVSHYLLVSSSGANDASKNAYLQMKGALEVQVKQLAFDKITLVQPSLILGQRKDFRFAEMLASYTLPTLCRLPFLSKYKPITGKQIAHRLVHASLNQTSHFSKYALDEVFMQ